MPLLNAFEQFIQLLGLPWRDSDVPPGANAIAQLNEHSETLLAFAVVDGSGRPTVLTYDGALAPMQVAAAASVTACLPSMLGTFGDLLDGPWPPTIDVAASRVTALANDRPGILSPSRPLTIVVGSPLFVTARLAAPIAGTLRIDGASVRPSADEPAVGVSPPANGGILANAFVDSVPTGFAAPDLCAPVGWLLPHGYRGWPGYAAESLLGSPNYLAEFRNHPPVTSGSITRKSGRTVNVMVLIEPDAVIFSGCAPLQRSPNAQECCAETI